MSEQVIGYRSYRIDKSGVLLPLFFQYQLEDGTATDSKFVGEVELAAVDLFDWCHSDVDPEIGDLNNWVPALTPPPFDEIVNLWDEGTDKGLYSFKELGHAIGYVTGHGWKLMNQPAITAKVQLAGVVVEHEHGYRSSMTRILELFHPGNEEERAKVAELIGWPFEVKQVP